MPTSLFLLPQGRVPRCADLPHAVVLHFAFPRLAGCGQGARHGDRHDRRHPGTRALGHCVLCIVGVLKHCVCSMARVCVLRSSLSSGWSTALASPAAVLHGRQNGTRKETSLRAPPPHVTPSSCLPTRLRHLALVPMQKLHVRSVPLHEQPRRIAHQEATRTLAVICTQATMGGGERAGQDACCCVRQDMRWLLPNQGSARAHVHHYPGSTCCR